jgi:DNA polymerase-3 subunit gamma/tau
MLPAPSRETELMARTKSDSTEAEAGAAPRPYLVLARKYRPQTFDDLIGQQAMVRTLRNAFASGRIAQGYMLTGVRGVGKTTTARILARALNYETATIDRPTIDMPELGRHCLEIIESRHPDVIEMDAASNTGVDNIREVIENARYKPILARTKVFIVDEVHMLSKGAFNALLKTLEEPPEHVKFIFATTEIRKVPVTVLSRCQRFDLRRVDVPELTAHLERIVGLEGVAAEPEALAVIAQAAGGSVRDGLSLLDQAIATGTGRVTAEIVRAMLGLADRSRIYDLLDAILAGHAAEALSAVADLRRDGADAAQLVGDLATAVHLATRFKAVGGKMIVDAVSAHERRRAEAIAQRVSMPLLARAWQMLLKGLEECARAPDPFAAVDMIIIRMAYMADVPPPDEIIKALGQGRALAQTLSGSPAQPRPASAASALNTNDESASSREALPRSTAAPAVADARHDHQEPDVIASAQTHDGSDDPEFDDDMLAESYREPLAYGERANASADAAPLLHSFDDVIDLARQRRDVRLAVHLDEHASLVGFDAATGSIDLHLLDGAPPEIANELREKLNRWTGRKWVVILSASPGAPPRAQIRREREAAEIELLKKHPAVAAVLATFPDAKITALRVAAGSAHEDNTGTG